MHKNVPRLILICGLPGSGKSTLAKRLAAETRALQLCGDEWMAQLAINLHDEAARARIEKLFWNLSQELLRARPERHPGVRLLAGVGSG